MLITGASAGIGYSTAIAFAAASPHDLKLILTARRLERLEECAEEINNVAGPGVKVLARQLDITDRSQVEDCIKGLPDEFKNIDILVNNASVIAMKLSFQMLMNACTEEPGEVAPARHTLTPKTSSS